MKTRKFLTLTCSRQISALCWALILAAGLIARYYPVRGLPMPLRVGVAVVLALMGLAAIVTSLGLFTEKGDERSAGNERRADAALFTLFFCAMGAMLIVSGKVEGWSFTLDRSGLLILFGVVCLARDLLFLGYERFSA